MEEEFPRVEQADLLYSFLICTTEARAESSWL